MRTRKPGQFHHRALDVVETDGIFRFRRIDADDVLLANEKVGLAKSVVRLGLRRRAKDHWRLAQPQEDQAQEPPLTTSLSSPRTSSPVPMDKTRILSRGRS